MRELIDLKAIVVAGCDHGLRHYRLGDRRRALRRATILLSSPASHIFGFIVICQQCCPEISASVEAEILIDFQ